MNRNAIFSAHNITLSDRKNAPLYSASQMLHLYLHAKQENSPLFLPDCCSEKELNAFAQFIEENKEAFTNTKKGLPW